MKKKFTHLDEKGSPLMVDVGEKNPTSRTAEAECVVEIGKEVAELIRCGGTKKGNPLWMAEVAGVMAAKKTPELIPLCHPILIEQAVVNCKLEDTLVRIKSVVKSTGKTGVEMEALTAVAVAGLTLIDMCKSVNRGISIKNIRLLKKTGGKSGTYIAG